MNKLFREIKFRKDCLLGKEYNFPIQREMKIQWAGDHNCGFYIVPELLHDKSVVYSFGVGEDISFDEDLIENFHCEVFAYDPTPRSKDFIQKKKLSPLHFFDVGISDFDGTMDFYFPENNEYVSCSAYNRWGYDEEKRRPIQVPVNKLSTLMEKNHHEQIDLLKMDIEGSEYAVLDDLIKENIPVTQICVEFHHRFEGIGLQKTQKAIKSINKNGFDIVAISDSREEYTFVRR